MTVHSLLLQELCEKVSRLSERLESPAASAHASTASEEILHQWQDDRGPYPRAPEDLEEVLPSKRGKIQRRKRASLVSLQGTASASQVLPAEVGNPAQLTPDTAGGASGRDAWQGHHDAVLRVSPD